MKTIEVIVSKSETQITNDISNFWIIEKDYQGGRPVGVGSTLEHAIDSFKESWLLKFDEEIEIKIV